MPARKGSNLADIAAMDVNFLVPAQVAPVIGCDQYAISLMAKDPTKRGLLGFPVIYIGNRTKIPRIPFLHFMGWKGPINGEGVEV